MPGTSSAALRNAEPAAPVEIVLRDCLEHLRTLPADSVDLIVTDPAYSGMNQHMRFGHGRIVGHYGKADNARWFAEFTDDVETYRVFLDECRRVLRDDRHIYIMFDSYSLLSLGALMREFFDVKGIIVWDKVHLGMGHHFRRRHETIVFASKGRRRVARRDVSDVWAIPRLRRVAYPTQKPVELFARMLDVSAEQGFLVCDPFTGSGSSAVAAVRAGCGFTGCDVDARAVALARDRCAAVAAGLADPAQPAAASAPPASGVRVRPAATPRA